MSKPSRRQTHPPADRPPGAPADGRIPDQSPNPALWKYLLIAAVLAGWLAFLIYCQLAGR